MDAYLEKWLPCEIREKKTKTKTIDDMIGQVPPCSAFFVDFLAPEISCQTSDATHVTRISQLGDSVAPPLSSRCGTAM
jgi:hypothetical protein